MKTKSKKIPTTHYDGHSKDRKFFIKVSMNNRYMSIIMRNRSTLKYDHISIIPWIEIKKLHLCKNRLKIVSFSTKKLPKTIVYFEKKIFKYLLNKCNNVSYLKQVKRPWYSLLFCCWNCHSFKPIKRPKSSSLTMF